MKYKLTGGGGGGEGCKVRNCILDAYRWGVWGWGEVHKLVSQLHRPYCLAPPSPLPSC